MEKIKLKKAKIFHIDSKKNKMAKNKNGGKKQPKLKKCIWMKLDKF